MPSRKPRTTTKSGNSRRSPKTATSKNTEPASATAPSSFESVFGKTEPKDPEREQAKVMLKTAQDRLRALEAAPEPTLALHRSRRRARLWKDRQRVKELEEYLQATDSGNN